MLRSWLRPVALTLALTTFGSGCATTVLTSRAEVRSNVDLVGRDAHEGNAAKAHHGGDIAAMFFLGALLIFGAALIDVIILPVTIPCEHPFCCCENVVHVCYH